MKKFLLFAITTLVAISANAQLTGKKAINRQNHRQDAVSSFEEKKISRKEMVMPSPAPGNLTLTKFGGNSNMAKQARGSMILKAGKASFRNNTRKAGTVLETYDAYGTDDDGTNLKWTMTTSNDGGTLLMSDVIPSILDGPMAKWIIFSFSALLLTTGPS